MEQTQTPISPEPLRPSGVLQTPDKDITQNKDLAALSYVWILSVVVYATRRDSPFIRFHAKQGMALFGLSIAFWFIPYVAKLLELGVLAVCVLGFLAAAQGEWKDQPVIGPLSRGDWKMVRASLNALWADIQKGYHALRAHMKKITPAKTTQPAPSVTPPTPTTTATPATSVAPVAGQTPPASVPSHS